MKTVGKKSVISYQTEGWNHTRVVSNESRILRRKRERLKKK